MTAKSKTAKKKKTAVKRKPNKTTKPDKNRILEYKGWTAGDRCYTLFKGDTKATLCDIIEFHPNDNVSPAVSLIDVATTKYRVAPVAMLAETAKAAKELKPVLERILAKAKKKMKRKPKQKQITEE